MSEFLIFWAIFSAVAATTYLVGVHAGRSGATRRDAEDLVEIDRILGAYGDATERRSLIDDLVDSDRAARERDEK